MKKMKNFLMGKWGFALIGVIVGATFHATVNGFIGKAKAKLPTGGAE